MDNQQPDPAQDMLDTNQSAVAKEAVALSNEPVAQDVAWWLDSNVPGQGERPEWLEKHFRSASEQAKAYREARKALGAMSGAPENYDLTEFSDYIDMDNKHLQDFLTYAKGNKINQEAISKTLKAFVDYGKEYAPPEIDMEFERDKFGKDRFERLQLWGKNNLSEKALGALSAIPMTSDNLEGLEELRLMSNSNIPFNANNAGSVKAPPSMAELKQELSDNYKKYNDDPAYRKEFESRWANLAEVNPKIPPRS